MSLKAPTSAKLPAKPAPQLNRTNLATLGLKGLPIKPDVLKNAKAATLMDDFTETGRKLIPLGDMPPVDMALVDDKGVGENLEADDDDDAATAAVEDVTMKNADEEEEEVDPLDAFMTNVNEEVKKVNAEDWKKLGGDRMEVEVNEDGEEEAPTAPDELDTTNLRPEDILA